MKLFRKPQSKFYSYDGARPSLSWVNRGSEVSQGGEGGKPGAGFSNRKHRSTSNQANCSR